MADQHYGWPKTVHKGGKQLVVETEADEVAACKDGWKHSPVKDDPEPDLSDPLDIPTASEEALVEAAKAFDHDGDGKPGGSKPGVQKKRGK